MRNRWLPKLSLLLVIAAIAVLTIPATAGSDGVQPAKPVPATSAPLSLEGRGAGGEASKPVASAPSTDALPDYGGRDAIGSAVDSAGGDAPASPLSQAWRAFEALVVVLACIAGVLFFLKKYGLVKEGMFPAGGVKPKAGLTGMALSAWQGFLRSGTRPQTVNADAATALTVLSSTILPGPAPASVHLVEVAGRRFLLGATAGSMTLLSDWDSEPAVDEAEPPIESEDDRFESYLNRMGMTAQTPPEVVGERVSQTADRLQALLARAREEAAE